MRLITVTDIERGKITINIDSISTFYYREAHGKVFISAGSDTYDILETSMHLVQLILDAKEKERP